MENLNPPSAPPPPPPLTNQGWENGALLPFARFHGFILDLGGIDGGLLIHFVFVQDSSKLRLNCRLAYPEISVKAIWFKVFPTNEVIFGVQTRDCLVNPQISKPFFWQFLICWKCIEENAILVSLYFFVTTVWSRTGSASENHGGWRSCRVICTLPSLARHLAFRVRCDVGVTCRTHSCPGFSRRWLHPGSLWSNENKTTQ